MRRIKRDAWTKLTFYFLIGILLGYALALFLSKTDKYLPLISLAITPILAIMIQLWREYIVFSSNLSIEINHIERNVSKTKINPKDYTVLGKLVAEFPYCMPNNNDPQYPYGGDITANNDGQPILYEISELDSFLRNVKKESEELPQRFQQIKRLKIEIEKIEPESFSPKVQNKLAQSFPSSATFLNAYIPFNPEYGLSHSPMASTQESAESEEKRRFKNAYNSAIDSIDRQIEYLERALSDLKFSAVQETKETIKKIKEDLAMNHSKFYVSASVVNSGRLSNSIKAPAILTIYITEEKKEHIKLYMEDPEKRFALPENSTNILTFESKELSEIDPETRVQVNRHWDKTNLNAVLFVEDVRKEIHASRAIEFMSGAQKTVYKRLSNFSEKYKSRG